MRARARPARAQPGCSCPACARRARTLPGAPPRQAGCAALRPTVQRGAGLSTNDTTGRWWDVMDCHGCAARDYRAELVAGQMFNLPRVAVKGAGRGVFSATFRCAARPALRQRAGTPRRGCCHACPRCMHVRGERTL